MSAAVYRSRQSASVPPRRRFTPTREAARSMWLMRLVRVTGSYGRLGAGRNARLRDWLKMGSYHRLLMPPRRAVRQVNSHREHPAKETPDLVSPSEGRVVRHGLVLVSDFRQLDLEIARRGHGRHER